MHHRAAVSAVVDADDGLLGELPDVHCGDPQKLGRARIEESEPDDLAVLEGDLVDRLHVPVNDLDEAFVTVRDGDPVQQRGVVFAGAHVEDRAALKRQRLFRALDLELRARVHDRHGGGSVVALDVCDPVEGRNVLRRVVGIDAFSIDTDAEAFGTFTGSFFSLAAKELVIIKKKTSSRITSIKLVTTICG